MREADDARFDGKLVSGTWLDRGLLQYPRGSRSRAARELRVREPASDAVELQRDLVLLGAEVTEQRGVLLAGARSRPPLSPGGP